MTNKKLHIFLTALLLCIGGLPMLGTSAHAAEDVSATVPAIPKDGAIPWDLFSDAKSTILSLLETEFGKLGRTVGEPARGNYTKASSLAKSGDTKGLAVQMRNLSLQENLSPSINTAIAWVFYEAGMFKEASVFALKGMRMNCTLLHERKEIAIGIYLLSQLRFANSVHVIAVAQNLIKRKKFSAHFFLYRAILLNITNFVEGAVESMQNYMLGFPEDKKAKRYFDVLNVKKKIILQNIDNPLGALNRPKPYYGFYNDLCTYRLFRGKNQMRGVSVAFDLLRKNISDEPENIIPRIAKYSVDRWNRTDWYQMLVDAGAVIHDFPEHPFGYSYKARCLWYLNRKDEAIRFYEKALAINPYDVDALQYLCLLYEGQKLYTKSVGVNDTLLAIEPFEPGHYGRCALYFLFLKDIKGAKTWLSEFIRVAKFENRENEFSNAIKHLEREIQYAEIRGR